MQFINLKSQYLRLREEIDSRLRKVLEHGQYIHGPEVQELEKVLADYVGANHSVTCGNGTDAIQLALMALGIGEGDAVIVPSFTFFATAEAVSAVGAEPVFADIDPGTFNLCPHSLDEAIDKYVKTGVNRLRAVMPVDLFGLPADYVAIGKICRDRELLLIEDGAQGFGGSLEGSRACSFGDIATTSFFPAKPLGCYGDGGAVFTEDEDLAAIIRSLCVHGKGEDKYENVRIGMNSRLDTIQAAVLLGKMEIFEDELALRNKAAARYAEELTPEVRIPVVPEGFTSSWAQYTLVTDSFEQRNALKTHLAGKDIPSAVYYPSPLHKSKPYRDQGTYVTLTHTEQACETVLSLPMSPYITMDEIHEVTSAVNSFFHSN